MKNTQKPITSFINLVMPEATEEQKIDAEGNLRAYINVAEGIFNRLEKEKQKDLDESG